MKYEECGREKMKSWLLNSNIPEEKTRINGMKTLFKDINSFQGRMGMNCVGRGEHLLAQ